MNEFLIEYRALMDKYGAEIALGRKDGETFVVVEIERPRHEFQIFPAERAAK